MRKKEEKGARLFSVAPSDVTGEDRTGHNGHRLQHMKLHVNITKHFIFTVSVAKHWHGLPREVLESPSFQIFKTQLDMVLGNLFWVALLGPGAEPTLKRSPPT